MCVLWRILLSVQNTCLVTAVVSVLQILYLSVMDSIFHFLKHRCVLTSLPCICFLHVRFKGESLQWFIGATMHGRICDSSKQCVNDVWLCTLAWDKRQIVTVGSVLLKHSMMPCFLLLVSSKGMGR